MPRLIKLSNPKKTRSSNTPIHRHIVSGLLVGLFVALSVFLFPSFLSFIIQDTKSDAIVKPFPISVNPHTQLIVENPEADLYFQSETAFQTDTRSRTSDFFGQIATAISSIPGYSLLGSAGIRFVTVYPGFRQEEVVRAFDRMLSWDKKTEQSFIETFDNTKNSVSEGKFIPGTYVIEGSPSVDEIHAMIQSRFEETIADRYSAETENIVPLHQALTIASMLERETNSPEEMRIISGIIWNRLWNNMPLQIDATLQYAKSTANKGKGGQWWPKVVPNDKYIKSPYNTYANKGLPPAPISNPSIAAVVAAINPKQTDCVFYFHDKKGIFYCTPTYEEHVALLKKYYGQGK